MLACAESAFVFDSQDPKHLQDPSVAWKTLSAAWAQHWKKPTQWIPAGLNFVRASMRHPLLSLPHWVEIGSVFVFTLLLSMIVVLTLYFWLWARPMARDWPRLLRSARVVRVVLILHLLLALAFGSLALGALLLTSIAIIYSRSLPPALIASALAGLIWILGPFAGALIESAEQSTALEALWKGRTRILYPPKALESLTPIEGAYWTYLNGGRSQGLNLLAQQSEGRDRALLESIVLINDIGPMRALPEVEKKLGICSEDPICNFNLVQISTDTQNLVAADRARSKIDSQLWETLTLRSLEQGSHYLWLPSQSLSSRLSQKFLESLRATSPLAWAWTLGLPVLLLILSLWLRRKASGVCSFTGEATTPVSATESSIYQAARNRGTKQTGSQRLNTEALIRSFRMSSDSWSSFWGWAVPRMDRITNDFQFIEPLLFTWALMTIWILALPSGVLETQLHAADLFYWPQPKGVTWSLGFLVIAISLQLIVMWRNWRKTTR